MVEYATEEVYDFVVGVVEDGGREVIRGLGDIQSGMPNQQPRDVYFL